MNLSLLLFQELILIVLFMMNLNRMCLSDTVPIKLLRFQFNRYINLWKVISYFHITSYITLLRII